MKTETTGRCIVIGLVVGLLALGQARVYAGDSGATELDVAVNSGDFGGYLAHISAWLCKKVPAEPGKISEATAKALLNDPDLATVLSRRQLISKVGAANLGTFAKAGEDNKKFLLWLLNNRLAMDTYLEAATPTGLKAREEDKWKLKTESLVIWRKIFRTDPDSKDGMCLKMAVGMAINPPPSTATHSRIAIDPVGRYQYFKAADKNDELFPSFRKLTAWEYSKVFCNDGPTASDEEFTWGRAMLRTFRPDFAVDGKAVNIVSMVWRRASPNPYTGMQTMLQGGGKCGPRSFFGVFINQAFGVPAIGVGQPRHACVAYKAADPSSEPQPGCVWKVAYGGGWNVSRVDGLKGPEFVEGVEARMRLAQFSQVEHLRWLASALDSKEGAGAVMGVARKIAQEKPAAKSETASDKTSAAPKPEEPVSVGPGVIHVEAASSAKTGGKVSWGGQEPNVLVHNSYTGGTQVYFQQQMKEQWADYTVDVPAAGTYEITMKAACINEDQLLEVCSGTTIIATVPIPLSYGLWQVTKPVALKLDKGPQTLRIQTPTTEHKRGIAFRWFELKPR